MNILFHWDRVFLVQMKWKSKFGMKGPKRTDPYGPSKEDNMYRTKNLGELRIQNVGETVELAGWIQKIRDLGGMVFIDLRDEDGITQIVINDEKLQAQAKELVKESCIHIEGKVVERASKNPKMPTGDVEVIPPKTGVGDSSRKLPSPTLKIYKKEEE